MLHELFAEIKTGYVTLWAKRGDEKCTLWFDLNLPRALDVMHSQALKLDAGGWDVYFSTCPSRKRGVASSRITQKDVCAVPALFMDIDTLNDASKAGKYLPSSPEAAVDMLGALPCPPSFCVGSGHGVHAYWLLDEPLPAEDAEALNEAKRLLKGFARGIAENTGWRDMDAHASEPARVLRVPGTRNHKGGGCLPVRVLSGAGARYSVDELSALMAAEPPVLPPKRPPERCEDDGALLKKARSAANGEHFARLYDRGDTSGYSSSSEADFALCNMLAFWTGKDAARMDRLFRASRLMRPKWDGRRGLLTYGQTTIEKAIQYTRGAYSPRAPANIAQSPSADGRALADLRPERGGRYSWNDKGSGYLFADWFKAKARYCPERAKWFIFTGKRWKADTGSLMAMELCKRLADDLMDYAMTLEDVRTRGSYTEYAAKWQRRACRETILKDAASVYPLRYERFDADPMLLNCLNGTLDLRTCSFRAHSANDFITKLAGVRYDPEARSERWEKFVSEVMQGDHEKAQFLQKALGYALTGDTRHECFFILYGPSSRNGKGTAMETFARLLGDYAKSAKPDTIAQRQATGGGGPSEDIARLAGARFVNISEPDKRLVLSSALVKTLTGNDTISARFLHENSFEYRPTYKMFINTNHLPAVTDETLFSSGRVKVIPFERHFAEGEQDKSLKSALSTGQNLSGILNWCIDGLNAIDEKGFDAPGSVLAATEEYRARSNKAEMFISDEMERDIHGEAQLSAVYPRYVEWCAANGFKPENQANFKTSLSRLPGIVVRRKRPQGAGREANKLAIVEGLTLLPRSGWDFTSTG